MARSKPTHPAQPGRQGRVVPSSWLVVAMMAWGALARGQQEDPVPRADRLVGSAVADFTRTDALTGKPVRLTDYAHGRAVVLVFTGTSCPIGDLLMPRLVELQDRYRAQGVQFLAVNANRSEAGADQGAPVAAHARGFQANFPVLLDADRQLADALEVRLTCESLLLDADRVLRYRGCVDNQYDYGTRKDRATHNYLADAIEALLADKPIETTATSAVGCPIESTNEPASRPTTRIRPAPEELVAAYAEAEPEIDPDSIGPVNYAEHVATLIQEKCQSCHRPGQVGPFSLVTYEDAKRWASGMSEVVETRRMPPWHADPRYGKFVNDRHLSARERATLLAWIDQGTPRGDAALEPPARVWPEGWSIGTPDVVISMPADFTVKPDGFLPYQEFRVKTGFTEDRWVQAIEPMPGDRSVVHHIVVHLADENGEKGEHLAAYAPGDLPTRLQPGIAKKIPANAELIIQMHYTPIGKTRVDRSSVGFVFAREEPRFRAVTVPIVNGDFQIPPGADGHEVKASFDLRSGALVIGFLPHMHLRGKDFRYIAVPPGKDQAAQTLLSVPRYDFAWQSYYWLKEPLHLDPGTRIECIAHFDNSSSNPALTPEQIASEVRWGDQTWEEMMIGYIDLLLPLEKAGHSRAGGTGGE